ncbi:hypothetical protein BC962_3044 [Gillisia mitskevichiae]|uniref:Uncharacterized protein n=1 Tax=Gillisia mitskevichiae TaxID=270921 RepID=A0A495NY04_9FLAO|nr:hypothetical protein [Gillisia mitskevichiae]RKS42757.1 hypothetical protein BC962_3044 [Gillisia mitskevichiae]
MKLTLKYIILLIFISGFCQEKESFELKLSYTGTKTHNIEIKNHEENTTMIVSKPYATNISKNDSIEIRRLLKINSKNSNKKAIKIIENNREYNSDTLIIPNGNPVINYVNDLIKNWKKIENNLKTKPDKRIMLDGYIVKISLMKNEHNSEDIYAKSPTKESHPEIFELISELEKHYKNESKKPVIN